LIIFAVPENGHAPGRRHEDTLSDIFQAAIKGADLPTTAFPHTSPAQAGTEAATDVYAQLPKDSQYHAALKIVCDCSNIPVTSLLAILRNQKAVQRFAIAQKEPNPWLIFERMVPRPANLESLTQQQFTSLLARVWKRVKYEACNSGNGNGMEDLLRGMQRWHEKDQGDLRQVDMDEFLLLQHRNFQRAKEEFEQAVFGLERWGIHCAVHMVMAARENELGDTALVCGTSGLIVRAHY
jgi:hypothetical protein